MARLWRECIRGYVGWLALAVVFKLGRAHV